MNPLEPIKSYDSDGSIVEVWIDWSRIISVHAVTDLIKNNKEIELNVDIDLKKNSMIEYETNEFTLKYMVNHSVKSVVEKVNQARTKV